MEAGELPVTLEDIDKRHPGWHGWRSQPSGLLWATSPHSHAGGSGTTLDADDAEHLDAAITAFERGHGQAVAQTLGLVAA